MRIVEFLKKFPSYVRWTMFEFVGKRLLGNFYFGMLAGKNIVRDLSFGIQSLPLEKHLLEQKRINKSETVDYDFSESYPAWFPRDNAFESKFGYLFSNCRVDPKFGTVIVMGDNGKRELLLLRSLIGFEVFMQGGVYEGLMPCRKSVVEGVIFPFASCFAYYHELVEVMLSALQARAWHPEMKLLLHPQHPTYIDDMLRFFGFSTNEIIMSSFPMVVEKCIVVPHWAQRSAVSRSDAVFLREQIFNRIGPVNQCEKTYVSRRKVRSRSLANEELLENFLRNHGFSICYFEEMSIKEQFAAIARSKIIVAVHGSGLANLVAANKGTAIVEIISPEWRRSTFARLSSQLGLKYEYIMAVESHDGFVVDIQEVQRILNNV